MRLRFIAAFILNPLSPKDYELLLDCLRELHSFRSPLLLREWLLESALPRLIPSDWISYNEVDLHHPRNTVAVIHPKASPIMEQVFPRFAQVAHQHPLVVRQMHLDDFPVHKISDFLTQEEYHQLELYQDVYRHLKVEYQIAATIKASPDRITAFALSRQHGDYTERDRAILEILRPHLLIAFNNLALAGESKELLDSSAAALNELCSATIIVNREGRILYYSGGGLQWIGATYPGILPAEICQWLRKSQEKGSGKTMKLNSDAGEIRIRVVPTNAPERLLLVLTRENGYPALIGSSKLALSKREREVASWVCQGKANGDIATILGISPRTVQKHVEHIYKKLGVESRTGLIAFLHATDRLGMLLKER